MLVFFATWCPHCQNGVQIISELEGEYGDLCVIITGIDGEDDPAKVRAFVENYGIDRRRSTTLRWARRIRFPLTRPFTW